MDYSYQNGIVKTRKVMECAVVGIFDAYIKSGLLGLGVLKIYFVVSLTLVANLLKGAFMTAENLYIGVVLSCRGLTKMFAGD